jgi:acyl carrier protein
MLGVADEVRIFIVHDLGWNGGPEQVTDDLPLIREGGLDSLGILNLVEFLESSYDIAIDDSEIVPEHFGSITDIEKFVLSKKA